MLYDFFVSSWEQPCDNDADGACCGRLEDTNPGQGTRRIIPIRHDHNLLRHTMRVFLNYCIEKFAKMRHFQDVKWLSVQFVWKSMNRAKEWSAIRVNGLSLIQANGRKCRRPCVEIFLGNFYTYKCSYVILVISKKKCIHVLDVYSNDYYFCRLKIYSFFFILNL